MGVIEKNNLVFLKGIGYLYKLINNLLSFKEIVIEFL